VHDEAELQDAALTVEIEPMLLSYGSANISLFLLENLKWSLP
jgi:hypothetical protein